MNAPICKLHRRPMKLVNSEVPRFAAANLSHSPHKWKHPRKIWRCPIPLCPCVESGPVFERHTKREGNMDHTNPW